MLRVVRVVFAFGLCETWIAMGQWASASASKGGLRSQIETQWDYPISHGWNSLM